MQCYVFVILFSGMAQAHSPHGSEGKPEPLNGGEARFTENKNQWDSHIRYKIDFTNGALFLEKNRFTYHLMDGRDLEKIHHLKHEVDASIKSLSDIQIRGHAFRVNFLGANPTVNTKGKNPYPDYKNYFIGNDESKWATDVLSFSEVTYENLYPGIDLNIYGYEGTLKYDLVVKPGASPSSIVFEYEGLDNIFLRNGKLHLVTSVGEIIEQAPFTFQIIEGEKREVKSHFKLNGNRITFDLPEHYNTSYPLVIDPILVFSTYTGSTADNFGFTATYDNQGNFYAGGIVFATGYPTTIGAYQTNHSGGVNVDVGITKYNPSGTGLIYSTYLGGSRDETPHSMIVNANNELIVFGATGSSNFPTTAGAYDNTFNGGVAVSFPANGADFPNGTDIFVSKLSAAGNALLGSTYIGGSQNDGLNYNATTQLHHNYGDQFRGEVIVDDAGNIYVASTTRSVNFPITAGALQSSFGGTQTACVFKLNPTLTTLVWSTFLGGSSLDAAYSLKLHPSGDLYVVGGTNSNNFPGTAGSLNPSYSGGAADGFISRISNNGTTLIRSTYMGTSAYDQVYFVEIDSKGDIYVLGQTRGNYPVANAAYSNAGGSQFIHKLNPALTATIYSTRFGSGSSTVNISPTAFLVDICENVFVAGWGGSVNNSYNFNTGATSGMPLTPNAYKSTTDGSDFYFFVLAKDAASLKYATYFGGNGSEEHVDGGTSRFDKNGIIYQAVCAGCGGNSLFPTTQGAWSNINRSFNCNLGSIKFEMEMATIDVNVNAAPATTGCSPLTVNFQSVSLNANEYYWDFGNGMTSITPNPSHTYPNPGTYNVMLIGIDSTTCSGIVLTDTAYLTIVVKNDSVKAGFTPQIISNCDSFVVQLTNSSTGATNYSWNFGDGQTSSQQNPMHQYSAPGTYTIRLIASNPNSCNPVDTIFQTVSFAPQISANATPDVTSGCAPLTVNFSNTGTGGASFFWDFGDGNTSTLLTPSHTFNAAGVFQVMLVITDNASCNITDTSYATIEVISDALVADFDFSVQNDCDSMVVTFSNQSAGATSWHWNFGNSQFSSVENPVHVYYTPGAYTVTLIIHAPLNCNPYDTVSKTLNLLTDVKAEPLTNANDGCVPHTVHFSNQGYGGVSYFWDFGDGNFSTLENPTHTYTTTGVFNVFLAVTDSNTCNILDTAFLTITVIDDYILAAFAVKDQKGCDTLIVSFVNQSVASQSATYWWDFGDGTHSILHTPPAHTYYQGGPYTIRLTVSDPNSCNKMDTATYVVSLLPRVAADFAPPPDACGNVSVVFENLSINATDYWWSFGGNNNSTEAAPSHTFTTAGEHEIVLVAHNPNTCNKWDTARYTVEVYPFPTAFFNTDKEIYQLFDEVYFENKSSGAATYHWEFGDGMTSSEEEPVHVYQGENEYTPCLNVVNEYGCPDRYCQPLKVVFFGIVDVPNAFSPNGDGVNDVLFVEGVGVKRMEFRIFNRWGELIFESDDLKKGWDGTYKGKPQEMETYVYTLRAEFLNGSETGVRKGNISLIR